MIKLTFKLTVTLHISIHAMPIDLLYQMLCHTYPNTEYLLIVLGVTLTNTLCWDTHIGNILKTCNLYLFMLSRIKIILEYSNP